MQLHLFHTTSILAIPTSTFSQKGVSANLAGHSGAGTLMGLKGLRGELVSQLVKLKTI